MNFERFTERCFAEWPQFGTRRNLARARHPSDRSLSEVLKEIPGMATENKLKLLNIAVECLAENEVYVEVGCYKGASLVGAALGHPDAHLYACDNFSQFDGVAEKLGATLARYTPPGQVSFFDSDFRVMMDTAPWDPKSIGAYFYDGGHSFKDQYEGLVYALPHLSSDAIIIIDDTNKRAARAANALFARQVDHFDLILDLRTPRNHSPTWWNGIQVYRYQRSRRRGAKPQLYGEGYQIRKIIYDDIVLAIRHQRRAMQRQLKRYFRSRRAELPILKPGTPDKNESRRSHNGRSSSSGRHHRSHGSRDQSERRERHDD
jgi:hypothetical protein